MSFKQQILATQRDHAIESAAPMQKHFGNRDKSTDQRQRKENSKLSSSKNTFKAQKNPGLMAGRPPGFIDKGYPMIPTTRIENNFERRIFTFAAISRAIRERGREVGLVGGDCYSDPPPVGCSLEFEMLAVNFATGLPLAILRHNRELCLRMVRAYIATATFEGGCDD